MSDTFQTLKEIMTQKLDLDPETIRLDSTLEELGIDSLDTFDLIFAAEDAYGIDIPNDQVEITTISDVVDLIDHYRGAGKSEETT